MGIGHGMVYMRVGHHKVVKLMTGGAAGGGAAAPLPPPHLDPPMEHISVVTVRIT